MMSFYSRPNYAEIDLDALESNYRLLMRVVRPGTRVIASLKGNAYGLGLVEVARQLESLGVPAFAAGSISDAIRIREAGMAGEIVVFGGALPDAMPEFVGRGLIPTAHNLEVAKAVSAAAMRRHPVYIKIDVGFGRLGVPLSEARSFVEQVAALPRVEVGGIYTHVPFGDEQGRAWAKERLGAFDTLVWELRASGHDIPVAQARASACILGGLDDHCNAVSPGGFLFGRSPLDAGLSTLEKELKPVLRSIRSRLIHISHRAADLNVTYPSRFAGRVSGPTGVVPFGRADGNRAPAAGQRAYMLIRGSRAEVLSVSSEHCVLDLSMVKDPVLGDEVFVIGESADDAISLSDVAAAQKTTGSDILLAVSGRMPRVFYRDGRPTPPSAIICR
ncbi:alanine racemase [Bradyrhizobium liaoningense]|uniref:alanine racemase n=1 Tax=Bradyrhizobium liaoningense TaxID=43992 RepID=UPI001BA6BD8E|nr:alanine racemase [Bradyrhizobium liaoningense]MBR0820300.1 alanine racemase [Bradyrhizobium liaoningense]